MAGRSTSYSVSLNARDNASKIVDGLADKLDGLTKSDQQIVLTGTARSLEQAIFSAEKKIASIKSSADDIKLAITARDEASAELERVQGMMRSLDGDTADVRVEAKGLDEIFSKLNSLPGSFGELGGKMGSAFAAVGRGGPVALGVAGIAGGLLAAANNAADAALEVGVLRDLTGSSAEVASRLSGVWRQSGFDMKDLQDVILQMNGVLLDSPEIAKQLGVNLKDGLDPAQRFVQVVNLLEESTLGAADKARIMSRIFGEEGVRQVSAMTTKIGDLDEAMANLPEGSVFDDEEIARAAEVKRQIAEVTAEVSALVAELGTGLLPAISGLSDATSGVTGFISDVEAGVTKFEDSVERALGADLTGTIGPNLDLAADSAAGAAEATDAYATSSYNLIQASISAAAAEKARADNTAEAEQANEAAEAAVDGLVAALEESAEAAEEEAAAHTSAADAILASISARRSAADSQFALNDAQRDFAETMAGYNELVASGEASMTDLAAAQDDAAQSAGAVADAALRVAQDQAAANGATLSAADAGNVWRDSMLQQASAASGPLQDAILSYVGSVEEIPPEKLTDIKAAIARGDLAEAERLLDAASETRIAEMEADAQTAEAERDLEAVRARKRVADIIANAVTQAASEGLEGVRARRRVADIVANALTGAANSDLGLTARQRSAIINAIAQTGNADSVLNSIARPRTAVVTVAVRGMPVAVADGGILAGGVQAFAAGGHRLPQHATIQRPVGASGLVQWAEPETGGEAFIPLASAKRRRSLEVWRRTGQLLGALPMADGGITKAIASDAAYVDSSITYITQQFPAGASPAAVAAAERRHRKRNGTRR
jgi:hypothetical protein